MLLFGGGASKRNVKLLLTLALVLGGFLDHHPHGSLALECRFQQVKSPCDPKTAKGGCMSSCGEGQDHCYALKTEVNGTTVQGLSCIALDKPCWKKHLGVEDLGCVQTTWSALKQTLKQCKASIFDGSFENGSSSTLGDNTLTACTCDTDGCNANCYAKCKPEGGASSIRPLSVPLQGIIGMMTTAAPVMTMTLLASLDGSRKF